LHPFRQSNNALAWCKAAFYSGGNKEGIMLKNLFYALVCMPLGLMTCKVNAADATALAQKTAHDFHFTSISGEDLPLEAYAGKPVLIVNTASECGFTPQYKELQTLYERYGDQGLVVIAVPSNDFGGQEPGDNSTIKTFCQTHYGINFVLAAKEHVKGADAHPFYVWARQQQGILAAPKWNFHKYLIAPDGRIAEWYASTTSPMANNVLSAIEKLLPKTVGDTKEKP
jgi:glutathione peroxidase